MTTFFSIITPSYNQARFIRQTIQSVLEQEVESFEHLVIDGGSTDGTVDILREYPHLQWVSEKDKGQSDALNKGIRRSGGRVIVWINSDDYLAPGALKKVRDFFEQHPSAAIVCGNSVYVDEQGREWRREPPRLDPELLRQPWRRDTSIFQPGIVFTREAYEKAGGIDESIHYGMDYEFFLRATEHFPVFHLPVDIGCFRAYQGTKTGDAMGPAWAEIRTILPRHFERRGRPAAEIAWTRLRLYLRESRIWMNDAMSAEETGRGADARHLYAKALLRNPFNLFCYPHVCFRLRRLFGRGAYERLRRWKRQAAGRAK